MRLSLALFRQDHLGYWMIAMNGASPCMHALMRPRMRKLIVVVAVMLASGCSSSERYRLDGASSDFCVPESQKVRSVPWVPDDPAWAPKGFTFAGCEDATGQHAEQCPFPASIGGGVVEQRSAFRSQKWSDFGVKSTLKSETLSPSTEMQKSDKNDALVVHRGMHWDVWSHTVWGEQGDVLQLSNDDVLLASCRAESKPLPGDRSWPAELKCRRAVLASDYAVEYSFRSENMSPEVLSQLDRKVIAGINQWRCSGKR